MKELEICEYLNPYNPVEGKIEKIGQYFTSFFGEKYENEINNRLKSIQFVFCESYIESRIDSIVKKFDNIINKDVNILLSKCRDKLTLNLKPSKGLLNYNLLEKLKVWKDKIDLNGDDSKEIYYVMNGLFNILPQNLREILKDKEQSSQLYSNLSVIYNEYNNSSRDNIKFLEEEKNRLTYNPWKEQIDFLNKEFKQEWLEKLSKNIIKHFNVENNDKNIKKVNKISELSFDFMDKWLLSKANEENYNQVYIDLASEELSLLTGLDEKNCSKKLSNLFRDLHFSSYDFIKHNEKIYDLKNGINDCFSMIDKNYSIKNSIEMKKAVVSDIKIGKEGSFISQFDFEKKKIARICRCRAFPNVNDHHIIHELSHGVQFNIDFESHSFKNGIENILDGFDIRALAEVVNEYFTLEVIKSMRKDNFKICGNRNDEYSNYMSAMPFVGDFIKDNLEDIKSCCMSPNIKFCEMFGKKNVIKLNKLIEETFDFSYLLDYRGTKGDCVLNSISFIKALENDKKYKYIIKDYFKVGKKIKKLTKNMSEYKNQHFQINEDEIENI